MLNEGDTLQYSINNDVAKWKVEWSVIMEYSNNEKINASLYKGYSTLNMELFDTIISSDASGEKIYSTGTDSSYNYHE